MCCHYGYVPFHRVFLHMLFPKQQALPIMQVLQDCVKKGLSGECRYLMHFITTSLFYAIVLTMGLLSIDYWFAIY